jgi:probable F420-dependent oxidoreductase
MTDAVIPDHRNHESTVGLILALTIRGLALGDYPTMVDVARSAENSGFDSLWLCDHFLTLSPDSYVKGAGIVANGELRSGGSPESVPLLECWTALSALSRDTTLRLGTSVLCNSYRSPSVLAKMAATLDVISNGRVELGLGAGWFEQEFQAYGLPFPSIGDRVGALEESLQLIRRMWTDGNPTFTGRYYSIDGAVCDPRPVQKPTPPIWVGGEGDRIHRIAARYADGINVRWWGPERCAVRRDYLDEQCEKIDRDPTSLRLSVTCLVAPTASKSETERLRSQFDSIPEDGLIIGDPQACVDRIGAYGEAGVDEFLFTVPDVGHSDHLELIAEHIMPTLKRPTSVSRSDS